MNIGKMSLCIMLSILILPYSTVMAENQQQLPGDSENFQLVGSHDFNYLFWDVYEVSLYSHDGNFDQAQTRPFMLELIYERSFSKENLLKETGKQFRLIGLNDDYQISQWLIELDRVLVNVGAGDSISLFVDQQNNSLFFHNGKFLGMISDQEFTNSFAGIWLSEKSSRPKMRNQLINRG